jgi:hypothetical protein
MSNRESSQPSHHLSPLDLNVEEGQVERPFKPVMRFATAVFDVSTELDTDHQQALVIAMHKSKLADAYVIYLFDDYQRVKPQINAGLGSLRFAAR